MTKNDFKRAVKGTWLVVIAFFLCTTGSILLNAPMLALLFSLMMFTIFVIWIVAYGSKSKTIKDNKKYLKIKKN